MSADARGDRSRLADILRACHHIQAYTIEGKAAFLESEKTRDAVLRNFELMGEAAGKLSLPVRSRHPSIEWSAMRGFASFAKHEYWAIDQERLWAAVEEIPAIERAVSRIRSAVED